MLQLKSALSEFRFDQSHYFAVAESIRSEAVTKGINRQLLKRLSYQELINYISCVMYTPDEEITIEVGREATRATKHWMSLAGIEGIVGLTPKFPIFNPCASSQENEYYVQEFEQRLKDNGIHYLRCLGRASDYRSGGDGCFMLNCPPHQAMSLLMDKNSCPTQFAILYLPYESPAQLISCID